MCIFACDPEIFHFFADSLRLAELRCFSAANKLVIVHPIQNIYSNSSKFCCIHTTLKCKILLGQIYKVVKFFIALLCINFYSDSIEIII